jgi:hypothetical protein
VWRQPSSSGTQLLVANGIYVGVNAPPPTAAQPGHPENFSGTLLISNNDIDVGAASGILSLGIVVFGAGTPDNEVDVYISGNNIRNIAERVIDINTIGGRVHIERNVITTGAISGPSNGVTPDVMNIVGPGSYLVAHNTMVSQWASGAGILVQGNPGLSEASAIVVDNDVTMSAPEGTVFGSNSGGIMIQGFAQGNAVFNNRIRGRARAGLVVGLKGAGIPGSNALVSNDVAGLTSTQADVLVDAGVTNTVVIGAAGKVEDHGTGTVIVPMH